MDLVREVHGACEDIYRTTHLPLDEPAAPNDLCRGLVGSVPEFAYINCSAAVARVRGRWRIFVRRGTPAAHMRFAVLHELAHVYYAGGGFSSADLERRCDRLGAALALPHVAFQKARKRTEDICRVAREFITTQGLALLRLGECDGVPVALVTPRGVHLRGEPYPWPLREMMFGRIPHHLPVRIIWITDEPRRVGFVVA